MCANLSINQAYTFEQDAAKLYSDIRTSTLTCQGLQSEQLCPKDGYGVCFLSAILAHPR